MVSTVHHLHHQQITVLVTGLADTLRMSPILCFCCIAVAALAVKQHATVHLLMSSGPKLGRKAAQKAFPACLRQSQLNTRPYDEFWSAAAERPWLPRN